MTIVSKSLKARLDELRRSRARIAELEAENVKLRQQRDAANAQIQLLNSIIAGDIV